MFRSLLRWLGRRAPTPVDWRSIPLPTREHDDGYERVVTRPDGLREHLPSRVRRVVPDELANTLANWPLSQRAELGPGLAAINRRSPLFEPRGRRSDGTATP